MRAVSGVLANLGQALRITGFWWTLLMIGPLAQLIFDPVFQAARDESNTGQMRILTGILLVMLVPYTLAALIGYLSTAIAWHRHLLLGETHKGLMIWPKNFDRSAYFLRLFGVGLCTLPIVIVVLALMSISGFLPDAQQGMQPTRTLDQLKVLPFTVLSVFAGLLFSLVLPAIAIGERMTFGSSLGMTMRRFPQCIMLAVLVAFFFFLPDLIIGATFGVPQPMEPLTGLIIAGRVVTYLFYWFSFIVSIGYLSEMYRSLVLEGE